MSKDVNAKYPYNGVLRVTAVDENGNTKKLFKSLCTAIEQSNDVTLPRNDDAFIKALKDKEVGVIFGREEYIGNDGKPHWSTKPRWYRNTESIYSGSYEVPDDQPLNNTYGGFTQAPVDSFGEGSVDSFSAAEDDIPF